MQIINPFPPLVFKQHYSEFNDQHVEACKEMLLTAPSQSYLETGAAFSTLSNRILSPHSHPAFQDFFNWQQSVAQDIILNQLKLTSTYEYVIGNSWANVHYSSGETLPHSHGLSALSCVAYITLPAAGGFTKFKDPHYDLRSLHERADNDENLNEWCTVDAIAGDVLFFPGWLQHRSQPNKSTDPRWIISSNYVSFQNLTPITLGNLWS
jgi:uncharacterized protein (TIGR02466 family)